VRRCATRPMEPSAAPWPKSAPTIRFQGAGGRQVELKALGKRGPSQSNRERSSYSKVATTSVFKPQM